MIDRIQTLKRKLASPAMWERVAYDFRVAIMAAAFIATFIEVTTTRGFLKPAARILAPWIQGVEPFFRGREPYGPSVFYSLDHLTALLLIVVLVVCSPLIARKVFR